ncbi:hypothetical protein ACFYPC_16930 [Streptomyces sp. NPDC005808]|uniref:hypothetical protein n=1 Tax=Streptomyces sp. NPDC005808 TaxID=3364734 RepID=UPI003686AA13
MSRSAWARAFRMTAAAALVAGAATVATPGTASAARQDCESGRNGFVDIAEYQSGATKMSVKLRPGDPSSPGNVTLNVALIEDQQRGFAALIASRAGDEFWMDWTTTYSTSTGNASSWVQCGPFVVGDGGPHTTAAKETNSASTWRFRACGSAAGSNSVVCTGWW